MYTKKYQKILRQSTAKVSFSTTNSKLAKDNIASFNLPALLTCPGAGDCKQFCYAQKGTYQWRTTMIPRAQNWKAAIKASFVVEVLSALDNLPKRFKIIRLHDSGDFFSQGYLNKWVEIMAARPNVKFYTYTKSHHLDWTAADKLPNFNRIQSEGSKHDHLIDYSKAFARIFTDKIQRGYSDSSTSDLPSANGNKKIGLILH